MDGKFAPPKTVTIIRHVWPALTGNMFYGIQKCLTNNKIGKNYDNSEIIEKDVVYLKIISTNNNARVSVTQKKYI